MKTEDSIKVLSEAVERAKRLAGEILDISEIFEVDDDGNPPLTAPMTRRLNQIIEIDVTVNLKR